MFDTNGISGGEDNVTNHICDRSCVIGNHIECCSKIHNIYKCNLGKKSHICTDPPDCQIKELTKNGDIVCLFSGIIQTNTKKILEQFTSIREDEIVSENPYKDYSDVNGKRDQEHICTKSGCYDTESLKPVPGKINTFACSIGNVVHICSPLHSCPLVEVTTNGNVCLFSGLDIGPKYEYTQFGKPKVSMEEQNDYDEFVDLFGDEELEERTEVAEDGEDNPIINEESLLNKKRKRTSAAGTRTKKQRTSKDKGEKKVKNRRCFNLSNPDLVNNSNRYINDILFNKTIRRKINDADRKNCLTTALSQVIREYKRCNRLQITPVRSVIDSIFAHEMSKNKNVPAMEFNEEYQNKLTTIILKLWNLMLQTRYFHNNKPKFHFKQHVLGSLYLMKRGLAYKEGDDKIKVIEEDENLCTYLPHQSMLKDMGHKKKEKKELKTKQKQKIRGNEPGYTKKHITRGKNNIKKCLSSLVKNEGERKLLDFIKDINSL
jgi:hypothetical protein